MSHTEWYKEKISDIYKKFNTSDNGLDSDNLKKNLEKYGENSLNLEHKRTTKEIILSQLNSPLVYILIMAGVLVLALGKFVDAGIILGIVFLNTVLGTIQEGKAENTLSALKKIIKSYANVVRDGKEIVVEDTELVPGDIILLKDGSIIPADARLIEATELKINQSALTGESAPVRKNTDDISESEVGFNDQHNMVFRGTYVISGLAKAVVVRTGIDTLIGQISQKLVEIETEIPLKAKIKELSQIILKVVFTVSVLIFIVGLLQGNTMLDMVLVVVAIAVSAIPESLPVIVTLVLASGVWRMSKKNVLVKRLQAVEALGQARIIAVDKTGTITKNQMTVGKIYTNNRYIDVTGEGYSPEGNLVEGDNNLEINKVDGNQFLEDQDIDLVSKISVFTAIAEFDETEKDNWKLEVGDPTEAALKVLGLKLGINKKELEDRYKKVLEIPFNMETKFHATVNEIGDKKMLSVAGGPEAILDRCEGVWEDGKTKKLDTVEKKKLEAVINQMSSDGYRILALAADFNSKAEVKGEEISGLTLVGFVGISDAIRAEVYDSVQKARTANMKVVMITGDHVKTAEAIARKVGIFEDGDRVMTGKEMSYLNDEALAKAIDNVTVFARVSPDDKLRIIRAFKINGDIVAMTGDGINDALSLVAADLGVAMGQNGTEVAREAGDIVLIDDNFGNIISAAEEGRNIYWIIRKVISHLSATNSGELFTITVAILIGLPLPLLATQILWMNFVTDTFLVSALSVDPQEKNIMSEIYRRSGNSLIDKAIIVRIILVSAVMAAVTLYLFYLNIGTEMERAWTISLTMLTAFQAINVFNVKSHYRSFFSKETFNNKFLILGALLAFSLHLFAIYNPFMQNILQTTALHRSDWLLIAPLALGMIVVEEFRKYFYRKYFMKTESIKN